MTIDVIDNFKIDNSITVLVLNENINIDNYSSCTIDGKKYDIPYHHNIAKNILPIKGFFEKKGTISLALNK